MKKNFIQKNKELVSGQNKQQKPLMQIRQPIHKPITMPQKIKALESKVERLEQGSGPLQEQILIQMRKIKEQIHELKLGLRSSSLKKSKTYESVHEDDDDDRNPPHIQQSNANSPPRNPSLKREAEMRKSRRFEQSFKNNSSNRFEKELLPLTAIQPFLKDYKFDPCDQPQPFYTAYHKKTSKQVLIKYSKVGHMDHQIDVYTRLWKNIVKARWPCINKIYEVKESEVNVLVMDRNVVGIRDLPFTRVLVDILKILEFIHECGYLYRNIQPEHFMLNEDNKLVVIDFKLAKRYTDIKNNHIEVIQTVYREGDFGSNNQLRLMPQGRKDDLQSLGYLALFLLTEELPWQGMSRQQMIKCRNGLTLQQLYKKFPKWLQYMVTVHKMGRTDRPDYQRLIDLLDTE